MARPILLMSLSLLAALAGCDPVADAPADAEADGVLAIGRVQGTGARSPLEGRTVTVQGLVSARMGGLGGVFIASETPDADPATAEGLFLPRAADATPRLRVGDRVRATGTVVELGEGEATLTALADARVEVLGRSEVAVVELADAPADAAGWEAFEGMRLRITAPLTVLGNDALARYGELRVGFGGRQWVPTEVAAPGAEAQRLAADQARRRLLLDDARGGEFRGDPWYLQGEVSERAPWRTGTVLDGVEGVLDQRHGSYRLQLLEAPARVAQAARPAPPEVAGAVRVASLNVLNLFNGDGRGGGFPTPRGAETPAALARQQAKLVAAIQALAPDVAALMEIENDGFGPDSALAGLVAALNAAGPARDWRAVDAGQGPGEDSIRVALLYRAGRVQPRGRPATLAEGPFAGRSRAPLAQGFQAPGGPVFVVAANHFKSKGSCREATGGDADSGDGQACFNATRVESARRLQAWLATDPTGNGTDLTLIIGDLNAYAQEDPLRWLRQQGWQDLLAPAAAGARPYSYVWAGESGRLDHALASPALAAKVRGAAIWHANADESEHFGYASGDGRGPWRASDHDPLLLGLDLGRQPVSSPP